MSNPGRRRSISKDKVSGRAPITQRPKLNVRFVFGPNSSSPKPNAIVRGPRDLGSSFSTTHIDEWDVTKHPYSHRVRGLPSGSISAFPVVLRDPCLENGQDNPDITGHVSESVSYGSPSTGQSLERSVSPGFHPGWEQFNSSQTTNSLRETPTSLPCSSEDHTLLPNRNTYQTNARSHEPANRTSNPCATPITGLGDPLDTEGEVSLDALNDIINLFQNTQDIEDSEADVPGPLPSTSVLPAHHLAVPQHVPDLNPHLVPYGIYPQAIAIPTTSPHGAGPSFLQFPTMNFAMHPQYLQPLQQASVLPSQSPNGFTGPIQQFPVLQHPQAAFHYPINPYLSYPPQTAYLQIPINPFFPPPVLAPVVPAQGDIWSTVFEHATDVRRQNTANRKRRKRTSSGRRAIPDAEHFCCPFCYRLFLRSNSYALHLKAHREAALNVIRKLQDIYGDKIFTLV